MLNAATFAYGTYIVESELTDERNVFGLLEVTPYQGGEVAKAEEAGYRWITLHPKGAEHEGGGVHVRIKVGADGSGHVVSGPGELRGLRLTRLASPEELAERRKTRDAARRERVKGEKEEAARREQADLEASAADPEAAQRVAQAKLSAQRAASDRDAQVEALEVKARGLREQLLEHAAKITGDGGYAGEAAQAGLDPKAYAQYKEELRAKAGEAASPELADDGSEGHALQAARGAGAVIASRNVRQVQSALTHLRRHLVGTLVKDPALRAAVLGEDGEVQPEAPAPPSGAPGYVRARADLDPDDVKAEAEGVFQDRLARLREDGQDERADAIVEMRQMTRDRAAAERDLTSGAVGSGNLRAPKPAARVAPQQVQARAQDVRHFLELHQQLQDLERQGRALRLERDPQATDEERGALAEHDREPGPGAELSASVTQVEGAFAERLSREIKDAAQADLTGAFLDSIDEDAKVNGYADDLIRKAMAAHIGVGAHAHLANVALAALGHEGLDRQVVDALGVEAASGLIAHALRRDAPERLADLRDGLARHHDETSLTRMEDALDLARAARADAAEIELPPVTSGTDVAVLRDLQRERKARIGEAHEALGTALGAVEAGAALNLALKGKGGEHLDVRFGNVPTAPVIAQLRALGLQDGEYALTRDADAGTLVARLTPQGMDRLTRPLDADAARQARDVERIKAGAEDEADWLPEGFMRRASSDMTANPSVPPAFQASADWSRGVEVGARGVAASLAADGWQPSEIVRHLLDVTAQDVPDGQHGAFAAAVTALLPFAREVGRTAKDGTPYTAMEATDLDRDPQVRARLADLARDWLAEHHPGEADFHGQALPDTPATREALFRAVAQDPALQAAFSPPGDLGGNAAGRERARAIKGYFLRRLVGGRLGGLSPSQYDERAEAAQQAALAQLGPQPEKWGGASGGLFGTVTGGDEVQLHLNPHATPEEQASALATYGLTPEHYTLAGGRATLNDAGKVAFRVPEQEPRFGEGDDARPVVEGGLDSLSPEWVQWQRGVTRARRQHPTTSDIWGDFKETMRGTKNAYRAVQEVMQGDLIERFAGHHAGLTGRQLRVSKMTTDHWERRLAATDPDKAAEIRARDRQLADSLRERGAGGQYRQMGEGGLLGAVQEHVQRMSRQSQLQGGFGWDLTGAQGGGEVEGQRVHDLNPQPHERVTVGRGVEARLAHVLNGAPFGLTPTDGPNKLIRNLTWGAGTEHVTKQRLVKVLLRTGRVAGWLGAGSGKTGTMLGAFTQAHADGRARTGLFVVPSIVRNQFGEAAAKFTEPGRYAWHARDDDFAGRKASYQGASHMTVVTHQTFRDDMLRLMAEHQGLSVPETMARFYAADRPARARLFRDAMAHHGIPTDFLSVDEAHDFLNRAGKADSGMSQVLEAALDNHKIKSLWTGSPVKNDPSEVFDWLAKLAPERFSDRDGFLRRYGVNTRASAEALQRLVSAYSVIDSNRPDVDRTVVWGAAGDDGQHRPIPLTPEQQRAYQGVHAAFERASAARQRGDVDVDACRVLSPRSFEGATEDRHRDIAAGLQTALGTLRHAALGRVVNEAPPEHNAKVQHTLALAAARKGKGGVIFARNRRSIEMLKQQLEAAGHRVGVIDGRTTTDGKGKVRNQFDQGEVDIVLCSDAGATGANLQHRGRWLVNYDLPQTQKTLEQRNARIDRLGQDEAVELHHLQTDTPYDRDNVRRLNRKRELGEILQGEFRSMEDTGLAAYLNRARAERRGDAPEGAEEPAPTPGPSIHENVPAADWRERFRHDSVEWGAQDEPTEAPAQAIEGQGGLFG